MGHLPMDMIRRDNSPHATLDLTTKDFVDYRFRLGTRMKSKAVSSVIAAAIGSGSKSSMTGSLQLLRRRRRLSASAVAVGVIRDLDGGCCSVTSLAGIMPALL